MPVRERDGLDVLEYGVFIIVRDGTTRADFSVVRSDGQIGQGGVREDLAEVTEGLNCDCAVGWMCVVLQRKSASSIPMNGSSHMLLDQ